MKILSWNIRGLNLPLKQKEIKKLIIHHKISILRVMETRVKLENFSKVANYMMPGWKVINNYSKHCLGKIWICWDPGGVKIDVVNVHAQVITCSVTFLDSGGSWMISAVYGATHGPERRSLFKELTEVKVAMGRKPWLITGDFNVIRFPDEKWGKEGFSCYEKEFDDCIQNLEVDDIAYTGCFHTWTNKQIGADFVSKKLDRVLANGDWLATFSNTVVEFLERGVSDHSSALVTVAK
jgi:exonuclease III